MKSCLTKSLVCLISFNIAICLAQHHHDRPSHSARKNIIGSIKENDDQNLPITPKETPEVENNIDGPHEKPAINMDMKNHTVGGNHTNGHNSSQNVECVCALFSIKSPIETDVPLMSQTFYNVSCHGHTSGKDACTEVCMSFATLQYQEKDNVVCSHLRNATDLIRFLHSKNCHESNSWIFTGMQSPKPICCVEGEPIECENKTSTPITK